MAGVYATYNGSYTKGYLQYVDLSTYHTLVGVPGNTYDVGIASGWEVLAAMPADGFWQAVQAPPALTSVPAAAVPGAFYPGSPGPAPGGGDMGVLEERSEEEVWAEGVTAAADPVYMEVRERLASAGEKLAALQRRQSRRPGR